LHNHRDIITLSGILITIPLIFLIDILQALLKRKFSYGLEVAYLLFVALSAHIGAGLDAYGAGFVYDKFVHFCSGILSVMVAYELFKKETVRLSGVAKFFFYIGTVMLVAIIWEIFEFTIDQLFQANLQRVRGTGVSDTMVDVISAFGGGVLTWLLLVIRKKL
jgi:uncharacterized membrane protein YjdF